MKKLILFCSLLLSISISLSAKAQIGQKNSIDFRVDNLLKQANISYVIDSDGDFQITLEYDDKRTQLTWIESKTERVEGIEVRKVFSIASVSATPPSAAIMKKLLEENSQLKMGGWLLSNVEGKYAVIFKVDVSADTEPSYIAPIIELVSSVADEKEKELTQKDEW